MRRRAAWVRLIGVALGYGVAVIAGLRVFHFSPMSPWFVLVAMICVLGLAAMARPVMTLRLPPALRPVRAWEIGSLSRWLGVRAFGRLLRTTRLRLLNVDVYRRAGSRDAARLRAELEAAEASHAASAALVLPYMVTVAVRGEWMTLVGVTLAQVVVNVYPVMHLRLARHRLDRIVGRRHAQAPARRGEA